MKRRIALLLVFTITLSVLIGFSGTGLRYVFAAPAFERVTPVKAVVTTDALNVRQGPSTQYPIVCVLKRDQNVLVFGRLGTWYAVYEEKTGCVGAVSGTYIRTITAPAPSATAPAPSPAPSPLPNANPPATGSSTTVPGITQDEQTLLNLINQQRAKYGVGALQFDSELVKCARAKAKDMVDNNYFSHYSPTYGSPFDMMRTFNVEFRGAAENIAGNSTLQGAVNAWMKSEGHRKNIVNGTYNYTGLGIYPSKTYGKVLVQMFIKK